MTKQVIRIATPLSFPSETNQKHRMVRFEMTGQLFMGRRVPDGVLPL